MKDVIEAFGLRSSPEQCCPFGNGHINDTLLLKSDGVILQRINTEVFPNVPKLMENLTGITSFLKKKIVCRGGNPERETITFLPTREGLFFHKTEDGSYWRAMNYIKESVSYEKAESAFSFEAAGRCFGQFLQDLWDYPVSSLYEIIPGFHNTKLRLSQFVQSCESDNAKRAAGVKYEIAFLLERKNYAGILDSFNLPVRVSHNDTKLNNILFDRKTNRGICVIDLDTVMPGFAAYDFGDALRTGACTAREDEKELSRVHFDFDLYNAFRCGFTSSANLSDNELKTLPYGAIVITYEQALRFLADYLNGDIYYKTAYPEHNLVRTRTQIALLSDMEKKLNIQ